MIEPNTFEFYLFLTLTLIILAAKLLLSVYLGKKVYDRTRKRGEFKFDFIFSVFVLMVSLFLSRLLYMIFDFYLTKFNSNLYILSPNLELWKFANFTSAIGLVTILFAIDKRVLKFKLKGILAYAFLIISMIQLIWPINTMEDYELVSGIGLVAILALLIVPIVFIYLGIKTPALRRVAFIVALGAIVYMTGSIIISEFILSPLKQIFGEPIQILILFYFLISKIVGLTIFTYGVNRFSN